MSRVKINLDPDQGEFFWLYSSPGEFTEYEGNSRTAELLATSWVAFLQDSPLDTKPKKVYVKFFKDLKQDLYGWVKRCAGWCDELLESIALTGNSTIPYFEWFRELPIFRELLAMSRGTSVSNSTFVLSFLLFGKKTSFDLEEFYATALRGWLETEEKISYFPKDSEYLDDLAVIVTHMLRDDTAEHFIGKHGPGAVAGPERGAFAKTQNLRMSPKIVRFFSDAAPLRSLIGEEESLSFLRDMFSSPQQRSTSNPDCDDISILEFVPKNCHKARSMCMEPTTVMFLQQGVRSILEQRIHTSWMSRFIRLRDQTHNADGALYGSHSGDVDTIDLSAASDSVSVDLIRAIFPREWLHALLATRTSHVRLPDGSVVKVNKFAPMGSALCFPVQSIVYLAVCILAYHQHWKPGEPVSDSSIDQLLSMIDDGWMPSRQYGHIAVYGDDIILDTRCSGILIDILEELKFSVNTGKSFFGQQGFRESCGIFAIRGDDVTPYQFKVKNVDTNDVPNVLGNIVEHINMCGDMGYRNLQRYLLNYTREYLISRGVHERGLRSKKGSALSALVFSDDRDQAGTVYSKSPINAHLYKREYSRDADSIDSTSSSTYQRFQRDEYHVVQVRSVTKTVDPEDEKFSSYLYHTWWKGCHNERSEIALRDPSVEQSRRLTLRWKWIPA